MIARNGFNRLARLFPAVCSLVFFLSLIPTAMCCADIQNARQLMDEGWWDDAEKILESLLKEHPDDASVYHLYAELYVWRIGQNQHVDWDKAEKYAKRAVKLDDENPSYYITLASCLGLKAQNGSKIKAIGRARGARSACEKAVEIDPDNLDARIWLLNFHTQAPGFAGGDKDEARRHAAHIAKIDMLEGYYAMSEIYEFIDKDYAKAQEELLKAINTQSDNTEPLYRYANFMKRRQYYERADSVYQTAVQIDSIETNVRLQLGSLYQLMEQWERAIEEYHAIIASEPDNRDAFMGLGFLYQSRKQWDDAAASFEKALEADSTDMRSLYQIGKTYLLAERNLDAAEQTFVDYLAHARLKGWWPDRAWAHYRLAMVYDLKGERKLAIAELKKAKKINPKHKEATKLLRELKRK